MNSLTSVLSGLFSSLLLSLGFSRLAASFDLLGDSTSANFSGLRDQCSARNSTMPCRWQEV